MENDPKAFVYWLNGFFELSAATSLDDTQVQIIKEHLALVLNKKTSTTYQTNSKDNLSFTKHGVFGGVVCKNWSSEEGGRCKKCSDITTTIVDVPTNISC
jgi:hypothetical protein